MQIAIKNIKVIESSGKSCTCSSVGFIKIWKLIQSFTTKGITHSLRVLHTWNELSLLYCSLVIMLIIQVAALVKTTNIRAHAY